MPPIRRSTVVKGRERVKAAPKYAPKPAWNPPKKIDTPVSAYTSGRASAAPTPSIFSKLNQLGTPSGIGGGSLPMPMPASVRQMNQPATYDVSNPVTINWPLGSLVPPPVPENIQGVRVGGQNYDSVQIQGRATDDRQGTPKFNPTQPDLNRRSDVLKKLFASGAFEGVQKTGGGLGPALPTADPTYSGGGYGGYGGGGGYGSTYSGWTPEEERQFKNLLMWKFLG